MNERPKSTLLPQESADVLRYYHEYANHEARSNGWKDKIPLGHAALRTILPRHSILPNGEPLLNVQEMKEGLDYIENPPKTDEYYEQLDAIVDKENLPYDTARRKLELENAS